MSKEERISIRAYAELCRTTHQTVSAAIKNGSIVDGYDKKEKKIIKSVADYEWGVDFMKKRAPEKAEDAGYDLSDQYFDQDTGQQVEFSENSSMDQLMRIELYYRIRERKQKVEKEEGMLVNKQGVYNQLFTFGKNLKASFNALPDTIIDQLMALNRDEAKLLLQKKIHNILESFSSDVANFNTGGDGWIETGTHDNSEPVG